MSNNQRMFRDDFQLILILKDVEYTLGLDQYGPGWGRGNQENKILEATLFGLFWEATLGKE